MTKRESPRQGGPSPITAGDSTDPARLELEYSDKYPWYPLGLATRLTQLPDPLIINAPWPDSVTVRWCRRFQLQLISRVDGSIVITSPRPCNSWQCPDCGPSRVQELSQHLAIKWGWGGIGEPTDVYYASFNREALGRVSQRLSGNPCPWVKMWWKKNEVHMFCTRALRGFKEPRRWQKLSPSEAIDLLMVTLALPYVTKTRAKHAWKEPARRWPGQFTGFSEDLDRFWVAVDKTVADISTQTGIKFQVVEGRRLPPEVDVEMFVDLLRDHLTGDAV